MAIAKKIMYKVETMSMILKYLCYINYISTVMYVIVEYYGDPFEERYILRLLVIKTKVPLL